MFSKEGNTRLINPGIDSQVWGPALTNLTNDENAYIWDLVEGNLEQDYASFTIANSSF